ncbi:hypothetical protein [Salinicoccus roseus]|uniref:hypothetical protein n=1 Tax=Salinicoccus roseus TaxID=45670 RepID=UPI0023017539|nr:hypothetical protein [Salinicoccus roseus]
MTVDTVTISLENYNKMRDDLHELIDRNAYLEKENYEANKANLKLRSEIEILKGEYDGEDDTSA